jgi:type III secretion protein D
LELSVNLELRILAGLHRGACIPVQPGEDLRIGSDESCDVVLVDADWTALTARLRLGADGWSLSAEDSGDAPGSHPEGTTDVPRGWSQTLDLAGVRFTVCDSSAPWSFEAHEPVAPSPSVEDALAPVDDFALGTNALDALQALQAHPTADDAMDGTPQDSASSGATGPTAPTPTARPTARKGFGRGAIALMGVAVIGLAGYSLASAYAPDRVPDKSTDRRSAAARDAALTGASDGDLAAASASLAASAAVPTEDELRQRFTERLKEAELLAHVDTQLTGPRWTVQGNLGPDEAQRLERVVVGFIRQHRPPVSIQAKILSAEELLPFKIQQITAGANASVVTTDGRRFYVGDGDGGYTLAKVDANAIVFTGKRRIEVLW